MDEREDRKERMHRKGRGRLLLRLIVSVFVLAAVITACVVVCLRFVFVASDITVVNETEYETSELMRKAGYHVGDSLFGPDKSALSEIPKIFPYVKTATVSRDLFSNPVFTFTNAEARLVLKTGETYLVLDKDFKILSSVAEAPVSLPLIVGIEVENTLAGTFLTEEDNLELSVLETLLDLLEKAEWMSETDKIDFTRIHNISFVVHGNLTVELGTSADLDKKMEAAVYVADRNDPDRNAVINVRNYSSPRYSLAD